MKLDSKRILVPVNGDAASEETFRWACQLAHQAKAQLHAVHVIEVPLDLPLEEEDAEAINSGERVLARIEAIAAASNIVAHRRAHLKFLHRQAFNRAKSITSRLDVTSSGE